MSKKLITKYSKFINESLFIKEDLFSLIELIKNDNPIVKLLLFLYKINDDDLYKDDSTINYISLSDSLNQIKYPPPNRRNNLSNNDIYNITPQTNIRIGRAIRSILNSVDKSKLKIEYNGPVNISDNIVSFKYIENNKDSLKFKKFIYDIPYYPFSEDESNIKIFDNDNLIIDDSIERYVDNLHRLEWDRNFPYPYFSIILKSKEISNPLIIENSKIIFEPKFGGKYFNEINDSDIEKFVNDLMASIKINTAGEGSKIEEVKGNNISFWYNSKNYQSRNGQLGSSCMSNSECESFLELYDLNKDSVSLLILKNSNDKLIGRALLWKLDKEINGSSKFMDRIYCSTDFDVKIFEQWAIDNNCIYRNSGRSNGIFYFLNGQEIKTPNLNVILKYGENELDNYPYMDTLCYIDGNLLANYNLYNYKTLHSTEGKWDEYEDEDDDY